MHLKLAIVPDLFSHNHKMCYSIKRVANIKKKSAKDAHLYDFLPRRTDDFVSCLFIFFYYKVGQTHCYFNTFT